MGKRQLIVGLTGGIGTGKTEATVILEGFGAYIIDADEVSRDLSKEGQEGNKALKKEFPTFFDKQGILDRRGLREYIFSNDLTEKLNKIMFPIIISEIENRIIASDESMIFVVAPLLIESGMHKMCDTTILITAEREIRIERIMARDNIDRTLAATMIDSQISDDARMKHVDIIIHNDYCKDKLYRKVKYYYDKIKESLAEDN